MTLVMIVMMSQSYHREVEELRVQKLGKLQPVEKRVPLGLIRSLRFS
jgi:hypothetical protein